MKALQIFLDVLRYIVLIPTRLFPVSWEGKRRSIISAITVGVSGLLAILSGLDINLISNIICSIVALWHEPDYQCNVAAILQAWSAFLAVYLPLVLEALKTPYEKSIFKLPTSKNE